jgi:hypothetical protein
MDENPTLRPEWVPAVVDGEVRLVPAWVGLNEFLDFDFPFSEEVKARIEALPDGSLES